MIRVHLSGGSFRGLGDEAVAQLRPRAERAVKRSLLVLEGGMKMMLSRPGRGRIYRRRGRTHQASAPGEPPVVDRGKLRASITHEGPTWDGNRVSGAAGTNDERAPWLEFGTQHMLPRPWARPAVEKARPEIERILGEL